MLKNVVKIVASLAFLVFLVFPAGADALSYEIYTIQPGDTIENLAARQGLQTSDIITLDAGDWAPGKRVALLKSYSETPAAAPAAQVKVPLERPRLASVIKSNSQIRSTPDGGESLFEPDIGSQVVVKAETATQYGLIMADLSTGWIDKSALKLESPLDSDWMEMLTSGGSTEVVQEAFRYIGLPYRYGGSMPYDTDCSLLLQQVFKAQGVSLPRTAAEQSKVGMAVPYSEAAAGDRLYFYNSGKVGHCGIYIGGGRFIHASSRRGCVAVDNLAGLYLKRLAVIRRS